MLKLVKDLTFDEYKKYGSLRRLDGNWTIGMALTWIIILKDIPKRKIFERRKKYQKRCEDCFKNNLHFLCSLDEFPNMKIDIETGKIEVE